MKKIKYAILVLILLLLVGCGANVDYRIDVNTEAKSIQIRTSLEVDESDYKYIKGGRDELVSIMQKEKPDNLEFDVDKDNENKFIFTFTFISYDDYLSQYKSITGETSSSTFDIGEYSKESPFQTYQNIKFEDDLSHLLNWLKEALLNSGSIDSEHKDSLIHNQNYQFLFDGQKYNSYSYQQEYEGKSIIPITQNNVKIIIKKENQINFYMSLIIAKDKVGEFTENLSSFMKERNVNLQYEEVVYNDISCMKYDIQMSNIDLSHEDSLMTFNSVFGEGFGYGNSKSVEKSSFIKDDYQQTLNLQLNFHSLFGLEKIHPVEIVVDVDGVSLAEGETIHQNTEMPLTVQELNDGYFNISLNTTYTSYRFITFVALFLIIAIIIAVTVLTVTLQGAERRIPVQYSRKVQGRKQIGGQSSYIPLKVNTAGVIPIIFAQSLFMFPLIIMQLLGKSGGNGVGGTILKMLNQSNWCDFKEPIYSIGLIVYIVLVIAFAYFYTSITFNPLEIADNMKKQGGFIPGIRPGKPTSEYLTKILNYIIFIGAVGLVIVAIIPIFFEGAFNASISFGGTSLIIIVGVIIETLKQIESRMLVRNYKGFLND